MPSRPARAVICRELDKPVVVERITVDPPGRGEVTVKAVGSHKPSRGSVFLPFHFKEAAANLLTIDALDPYGKIPEFKFCAVRVEKCG